MSFFKAEPTQQEIADFVYSAHTPFTQGNTDKVKAFVKRYPKHVDAQDKSGNTALIQAARYGYADTVAILLDARANPQIYNAEGKNAIMLARGAIVAEMLLAAIPDTPLEETVNTASTPVKRKPKLGM